MDSIKAKTKELSSNQERIDYYESILLLKENQLHFLSKEIGFLNEVVTSQIDKAKKYKLENDELIKKMTIKVKIIKQELDNKELMLTRLNKKAKEIEKVKSKIEGLEKSLSSSN